MLNKNHVGLTLGAFFAFFHLVWLVLVVMGVAKKLLDWVLSLHQMTWSYTVNPFDLGKGIMLLIITFIAGYILGWVLAAIWNYVRR